MMGHPLYPFTQPKMLNAKTPQTPKSLKICEKSKSPKRNFVDY
jgi:hypothetical protein